jgi:hypothetical protein
MKTIATLITLILITACSAVPNPKITFGKKCQAVGDRVTYSYVWIYDGKTGLPANSADCALIADKKK